MSTNAHVSDLTALEVNLRLLQHNRCLSEFAIHNHLPTTPDGNHFTSYLLSGPQVGAVVGLLHAATLAEMDILKLKLAAKSLEVEKLKLEQRLQAQEQELTELRELKPAMDYFIADLDPDR